MDRRLESLDVEMFRTLSVLRDNSRCIDKQVACVIVDVDGNILSVGMNTIINCNKKCDEHSTRVCEVRHAEQVAVDNLSENNKKKAYRAYVSLYPCVPCQRALEPHVKEIVSFGMIHRDTVLDNITVFPHLHYKLLKHNKHNQPYIVSGELGELITAISDLFARDRGSVKSVANEVIDVELQLELLKLALWEKDHEFYNVKRALRNFKYKQKILKDPEERSCDIQI